MRLDPEHEKGLRATLADPEVNIDRLNVSGRTAEQLVAEIDYLREQVQAETHHASELKRMLAGQTSTSVSTPVGATATSAGWGDDA